ncbi:MAG: NAD-dependent epimerase/dehydratase family protein [Acidobacteria bacterium]|nr:NAD-dependent epimerase/dehydratase family protein [Acidobacteriota bacterium]
MKVLVTGGTGYLGRSLVTSLRAAGHTVVLYARTASASGLPVHAVDGDIRDASRLDAASDGCEAILHTAALVAVWRPRRDDFDEVNVAGLRNVLAVAKRRGVTRVLCTSSFLALPPAGLDQAPAWNDYQRTKAEADRLADMAVSQGAPVIRLYPGVIYGPGPATDGNLVGRMIADHLRGRLPGVIGASRIWSFAYLEDVAAAHVAALTAGVSGRRYLLGGENAPQMRIFDIVHEVTGRARPRRIPDWAASIAAAADELRAACFRTMPVLTTGTLEILLKDWPLGHALASEELGYSVTPLDAGIRHTPDTLQVKTPS